MEKQRKKFTELATSAIKENRNLVISKDETGLITIAQQLVVNEGERVTLVFLKGAIEVEPKYLLNLRDAINEVIQTLVDDEAI